jgi:hypothetical protein
MTSAEPNPEPAPPTKASGTPSSKSASATARIIRESDMMRAGYDAVLREVAAEKLVLEGPPGLALQDQLKIKLHHLVQRFDKEVRGLVRQIEPVDAQTERITVELFTRLTPVEVSVLKMGLDVGGGAEKRWY